MTESQGLQLQIQTVQFTPAIVTFNADQIASVLNLQLMKYKGLTFTEDTEADAKKIIAELRKGKALLDTYRKTTKAELTVAVTEFEQQIKELANKFDLVILPLTEQTAQFEKDRVEKKRAVIVKIIADLIIKFQLQGPFAEQLIATESYLNRTTTMGSINSELLMEAESLKADQDRRESELALIRSNVEIANQSLSGAGLLENTYTRLLGSLTLVDVLSRLNADVDAMKDREAKAAARILADAKAREELAEKVKADIADVAQANREAVVKPLEPIGVFEAYRVPDVGVISRIYKVTGTVAELDELEDFLNDRIYDWRVSSLC